jgi:tetratricopeptide (TPR) repeat protein
MLAALVLALSTAASSAAPAPAPTSAQAPRTLQEEFDAATQAVEKGNCKEAVGLFESLEHNPAVKPGGLPAAAIAVRKGKCLIAMGRRDEGKALILADLPKIATAGESFAGDVYLAQMALGDAAFGEYDYGAARERYEAALKLTSNLDSLVPLMALSKATSFDGSSIPLDYAQEGLRIIGAQPEPNKALRAGFLTIHARALLNQGQVGQAYDELKEALKLSGGLTDKISLGEAMMRSDLADAALLDGKRDDAHRYLAYTGAGRIAESPFVRARNMDVPVCGSETGLRPEDVAVVEFSIDRDGSVLGAQTIYTRGGPAVAAAFASAVRKWYWDPEQIAKIPAFYLLATRVELRCTRAGADAPGVTSPLVERFYKWAADRISVPADFGQDAAVANKLRPMLSAAELQDHPDRYVAIAGVLSQADPRRSVDTAALLSDALSTARKTSLPAEVTNALQVLRALSASPWTSDDFHPKRDLPIYAKTLFELAAAPDISQDAIAADTLRLSGAKFAHWFGDPSSVVAQLELVDKDTRLAEHHPLRQAADLQLANLAAQSGQLDKARSYFERTGLTEEQCSMLGIKPALNQSHASSSDYPTEALMYGFEGWTEVEYDVKADGRTLSGRTLMAYPPFVFSDGAAAMTKDFVFEKSYRPGDSVACAADRQSIGFHIPGAH